MVCMAVGINQDSVGTSDWRKKLKDGIESGELGINWEYLLEAETDEEFYFGDDIDLQDKPYHLFFHATIKGQTGVVSFLLTNGLVDIDFKDSRGWTALDYAQKCRRYDVIHCLINAGAAH